MKFKAFQRRGLMRWIIMLNLLLVLLPMSLFSVAPHVQARSSYTSAASTGHVTIIVLDMSGSMAHNDPDGTRCSATNAYIDMSGPGDEIGIVGLDGQEAPIWAPPTQMDTRDSRQALKTSLAKEDNNCRPDSNTPTYDALRKALTLLAGATRNGKQGSIILLTDGLPAPDQDGQEKHIQSDLVAQFQDHHWPIDTVALGHDDDFTFLHRLSDQTTGNFYSDTSGVVEGESPLNIMPFFIDIFRLRNHRTPGPTLSPTTLNGEAFTRDFDVGDYEDHLDVVAIKDSANLSITLTAPDRRTTLTETSNIPGVFVSPPDPHYVIFSIDEPQKGTWHLNVSGTGQFLMDSLIVPSLSVAITDPDGKKTLPLNQPFTLSASLQSHGTTVAVGNLMLHGTISRSGKEVLKFPLTRDPQTGLYTTIPPLSMPVGAAIGSYEITVAASAVSSAPIAQAQLVVQFDQFPAPSFFAQAEQPTSSPVDATVVAWDPGLRVFYGLPLPVITWLSQWPLQHLPAQPSAMVHGEVQRLGQPEPHASVTAITTREGSPTPIDTQVVNDGAGRFHVVFPSLIKGTYTVTFTTQGSFGGSSDFGTTQRIVRLVIIPATLSQEIQAWEITALYLFLLVLVILLIRFPLLPPPNGRYTIDSSPVVYPVGKGNNILQALRRRNLLRSRRALIKAGPGLQLLVNYDRHGGILVRRHGPGADKWFTSDEQPLKKNYTKVHSVLYSPSGKPNDMTRKKYSFQSPPPQAKMPATRRHMEPRIPPRQPGRPLNTGGQPRRSSQRGGNPRPKNRI